MVFRFFLVSTLVMLTVPGPLLAESASAGTEERIGLVLGGGGARGAAHVGVLRVLEAEGIAVDYIAGTSMGAIVGALYASGYRPDDIEQVLESIDWPSTLRDNPPRRKQSMQRKLDQAMIPSSLEVGVGREGMRLPLGLLQGQNLTLLLRALFLTAADIAHFDELPIPFRAVAADVVSGEKVVFESGDLVTAVRASMSVPGIFQPLKVDGRLLVDGGIVDNVPIDVVRDMGATRLIVVDVGSGLAGEDELDSPAAISMQVISILMERQTRQTLESLSERDLLLRPDLGDIEAQEFDRSLEAVPTGERAALASVAKLKDFAAPPERLAQFEARPRLRLVDDNMVIDRVKVNPAFTRGALQLEENLAALEGQTYDSPFLREVIALAYGEGHYERIEYRLETDEQGRNVLRVSPYDKSWGPNFLRLGLRLSDDFQGGSAYQLDALARFGSEARPGAEWRMRLGLGEIAEIEGGWLSPFGRRARTWIFPYAGYRAMDQPLFIREEETQLARLRWQRSRLGIDLGYDLSSQLRTFVRLERGRDNLSRNVGPRIDELARVVEDYGFVGIGVLRDSLDDSVFPSSGSRLDGRIEFYNDWMGSTSNAQVLRLNWDQAFSFNRYIGLAGVRAVSARDDAFSLQALDFLGGLGNLSGYGERDLGGSQLFLTRAMVMRRIGNPEQLMSLPAYLGISAEAGNVWPERTDFDLDDLIFAGSLFIGVSTPLGPIFLGVGRADTRESAIYLNFGSLIRTLN